MRRRVDPLVSLSRERVAAHERPGVEVDGPRQTGLERRGRLAHVQSVERVLLLHARAPERPEPAGPRPRRRERVPHVQRVVPRVVELEAELTRVPGPRDQGGHVRHRRLHRSEVREVLGGQIRGRERREQLARAGSLHRQVRRARDAVRHVGATVSRVLGHVALDRLGARRRGDQPVVLGPEPVGGQVVDHPSGLVADRRVQDLAVGGHASGHVAREHVVEQRLRVRALDVDRPLVVHVVQTDALAGGHVLLLRGGEHDRGVEPDPIAHLGSELHEPLVVGRVTCRHDAGA